jgi:hypothetical protein
VMGSGGGAAAMTRVESVAPTSKAALPFIMLRRDIPGCFIGLSCPRVLARHNTVYHRCHLQCCGRHTVFLPYPPPKRDTTSCARYDTTGDRTIDGARRRNYAAESKQAVLTRENRRGGFSSM